MQLTHPASPAKTTCQLPFLQRLAAISLVLLFIPLSQADLDAQQSPYAYAGQPGPQSDYGQPAYPPQPGYAQPQPGYGYQQQPQGLGPDQQGLAPDQLEQLVAPIALNPDPLVALMLAASTYPQQVTLADRWRQSQPYATPDQIAYGADLQNWDPSVKALAAFPQVLAEMDQNIQWTAALGNAYYNQPQDVLDAIQIMRQRAQAAGNLQSSPEEAVSYNQGYIQLTPPNPQVIYVPAYNPWTVYGQPVSPYPGFSLLGALGSFFSSSFGSSFGSGAVRFGLGTVLSAFSRTPWGLLAWGLNWLTQNLLFHNSNYYSGSTTVADWGLRYGGPRAYMAPHRSLAAYNRTYDRSYSNRSYGQNYARGYGQDFNRSRSAYGNSPRENYNRSYQTSGYNYNRSTVGRSQSYIRPAYQARYNSNSTYNSAFASRQQSPFAARSSYSSNSSYGSYRVPVAASFNQRTNSYAGESSRSNSFMGSSERSSSGFHLSGGSHNSANFGREESFKAPKYPKYKEPKAPKFKEPKAPKMHSSSGHSSGHSGGHHH